VTIVPVLTVLLAFASFMIFLPFDVSIGVRFRISDVAILAAAALFLPLVAERGLKRSTLPFLCTFLAFAVYVGSNAYLQVGPGTAAREFVQLMVFALFFMMLVQALQSDLEKQRYFTLVFFGLWALALANAGWHLLSGNISGWKKLGDMKITHSLLLLLLFCRVLAFPPSRNRSSIIVSVLLMAVAVAFVLLSGERKGWAAFAVGASAAFVLAIPVMTWSRLFKLSATGLSVAIGLAVTVATVAPQNPYISKQIDSIENILNIVSGTGNDAPTTRSNAGRLYAVQNSSRTFQENPVFGIGPGEYRERTKNLNVDHLYRKGAHNEILRIAAELGTVGLAFFAMIYVVSLVALAGAVQGYSTMTRHQRFCVIFGGGLLFYGFSINLFLAGGGLNMYFVIVPAAIIWSVLPAPLMSFNSVRWRPSPIRERV